MIKATRALIMYILAGWDQTSMEKEVKWISELLMKKRS